MTKRKNDKHESEKLQNAYFVSLELGSIRCFREKQQIDFSDGDGKPRQWTIILGDNGTGKTTILQLLFNYYATIFMTGENDEGLEFTLSAKKYLNEVSDQINNLGTLPIKSIKRKQIHLLKDKLNEFEKSYKQRLELFDTIVFNSKKIGLTESIGGIVLSSSQISNNCFAYGAARKIGESSISEGKEFSFKTLFDEKELLLNPEEWILQADYAATRESEYKEKRRKKFEQVKEILIKILPDVDDIKITEKEKENALLPVVEFLTPYGWVEAKDLSLGYRTSMAWMVDFASRMFDLYPESENPLAEPAVVLIDEIDLHLHPKWQRELIDYLSELFPNTQFIVTTHSPLIVQAAAARDANIAVCRREGDHVVIDQTVEAVRNWRADQILTSDLFGLETARPKETGKLMREKERILSKPKLSKKDEKRLAELDEEIGFLPVSENGEEDEAMKIIKQAADWIKTQAR